MQKYISQPSSTLDGTYEVARWDELKAEYTPIETGFPNEELSKERAHTLNEEYAQDLYEYEHQDDMISKAHDFVHSNDIQKQNTAEEFLSRSKYQREVCDEILEELDEEKKAMTKDIDFPQSAFSIMKRSLEFVIEETTSDNSCKQVLDLLHKVELVIDGNTQHITPYELQELNRCVMSLYAHIVTTLKEGSQEDRQWLKVNQHLTQYVEDPKVMGYNVSLRK